MTFSHSPLLEAIQLHAVAHADKVAIVEGDNHVSYSLLYRNILKAASFLYSQELTKGDSIVLTANKDLEFVYLYFASHLVGVRNIVMDPTSNEARTAYIIGLIQPKVVFGFEYNGKRCLSYKDFSIDDYPEIAAVPAGMSADDTADIMFTTGTTGAAKGVLLSNYNIFSSASNINSFIGNTEDDIEALGLPICHSFGLGRLRCTLLKGGTLVLLGGFANIKLFFNAIERHHVTGFGMVPAVWAYIKKFSGTRIGQYANQIRYIEIGSAAMNVADKELLMQLFPNTRICMHYGLTEASRSLFMEFHQSRLNLTTIGKPVCEAVTVKVLGEDGKEVPCGEEGEICISGNMVMKSYYLEKDNDNAFWNHYFRTGDWGYVKEDGNFYLVSRKKELINVGGKKVNPIEIEEAIVALGFEDCACIGIKDDILGEAPKAYVVKGDSSIALDDISKLLAGTLEPYKIPVQYEWIDNVPKTSSGKKQRLSLKQ